jgi:hypothetical protein
MLKATPGAAVRYASISVFNRARSRRREPMNPTSRG